MITEMHPSTELAVAISAEAANELAIKRLQTQLSITRGYEKQHQVQQELFSRRADREFHNSQIAWAQSPELRNPFKLFAHNFTADMKDLMTWAQSKAHQIRSNLKWPTS